MISYTANIWVPDFMYHSFPFVCIMCSLMVLINVTPVSVMSSISLLGYGGYRVWQRYIE